MSRYSWFPTHGISGTRSKTPAARKKKWSQLVRSFPRSTRSPASRMKSMLGMPAISGLEQPAPVLQSRLGVSQIEKPRPARRVRCPS